MATNVADLVCELHADEMRGVADVLARYRDLVRKAAAGPLAADEAVAAATCAYELQLPPDRFDRDVAAWRQSVALEQQIRIDDAEAARNREKCAGFKQRLEELEIERRQTLMEQDRLVGQAHNRTERRTLQARIAKEHPHLFGNGVLTTNEWAAVRH